MVWNTSLLAQYVILRHVLDRPLPAADVEGALRYFTRWQLEDGSWGMHPESLGYLFHTTLAYVALRLLGVDPGDERANLARRWIEATGGPAALPSWGKFWLALLGLYDFSGLNPVPPELFLLPRWLALSPWRLYCHTRYALLPMAYLYGRRFQADLGPLGDQLRGELYPSGYATTDFARDRSRVAPTDLRSPPHPATRVLASVQAWLESHAGQPLRTRALRRCLDAIVFEQRYTGFQGLSTVNAILNCLALSAAGRAELERSLQGLEAWTWRDDQGLRVAGARSTVWDTSFALRALIERGESRDDAAVADGAAFLRSAQLLEEVDGGARQDRDPALGGWCFTEGVHRWPVSDCAAEALSALLEAGAATGGQAIPPDRARLAVEFILSRQNRDGGFGSYERRRGGDWWERLNPSEMYLDCMTEKSYTECAASCVGALCRYQRSAPDAVEGVADAIRRGLSFLRGRQRPDGSFAGSWGVNFVYATFHVLEAFAAAEASDDPTVARGVAWLLSKQRPDGGWGEHWSGCLLGEYVEHEQSQVTTTAWAVLALLTAAEPPPEAIGRGLAWLVQSQEESGTWPRQSPAGVVFRSAALDYSLYRQYFSTWALVRASARGLRRSHKSPT